MVTPQHVAIIMDGNGRWAQHHGRPRAYGHVKGARVAKKIISKCSRLGVKCLTLYAFSTENWSRPQGEIALLMRLLRRHLKKERANLVQQNIRFRVIGDTSRLSPEILNEIKLSIEATQNADGMELVFALSYGGRQEIANIVQGLAQAVVKGELQPSEITEQKISHLIGQSSVEDPDFIIRTSGEMRLSNFLLWQSAYSELYFTKTLWPDFSEQELLMAFESYALRERRFGKTTAQVASVKEPKLDSVV